MSFNKTLLTGVAAAALLGSTAMADEPVALTDTQMDDVTAGFLFAFAGTGGFLTEFAGLTADADVKEESSVTQSEAESFSIGTGGASGSASASATAKASIKGNFKTTFGGGSMFTGGTLAFSGNL
jgi:hypothetical protein